MLEQAPVSTKPLNVVAGFTKLSVVYHNHNQHYTCPRTVNQNYVERQEITRHLASTCLPSDALNPQLKCYVLHGMGGLGKTEISLKFAEDHRER